MKISSITGGRQTTLAKKLLAASALMAAIAVSGPAFADTFTLSNSNGGDGFVNPVPGGFDLFGSDNGSGANYTYYTATASANKTFTVNWIYTTNDCCGSYWDPAGYVVNGVTHQLSTDTPFNSDSSYAGQNDTSGSFVVSVLAGWTYGMYVFTQDGLAGRADILVTPSETPLPAALPLFISGLAGMGLLGWRKKRKAQAAMA